MIIKTLKYKRAKYFFLTLSSLWAAFIFTNSTFDIKTSSASSEGLSRLLINMFSFLSRNDLALLNLIVRKAAHFCSFMILACLVLITFYMFSQKLYKNISNTLFICLCAAVFDESIQMFSNGRGSSTTDIWIDFSGAVFAVFTLAAVYRIKHKKTAK